MKKNTKKAWKEYFEEDSNWKVCTRLSEYGMQITRLVGTEVFALERWHVPADWLRERHGKVSYWDNRFYFVLKEDENMDLYPNELTKTSLLDELYRGKYLFDEKGKDEPMPW